MKITYSYSLLLLPSFSLSLLNKHNKNLLSFKTMKIKRKRKECIERIKLL